MKGFNKLNKIYIYFLLILDLLIGAFIPFVIGFHLANQASYLYVVSGFSIVSGLLILLIFISELVSLRIDRTATKNTFYAALFILISLLTCKDFVYFISLFFPEIYARLDIVVNIVLPIVMSISYVLAIYFLLRFYEKDYGAKKLSNKFLVASAVFIVIQSIFLIARINVGTIITVALQAVATIGVFTYVLTTCSKNNYITAVLTYFIALSFSFVFLLNAFQISGPQMLFYASVGISFLFIYLNFFINKTNMVYQYDDEQKERAVDIVMKVKCFQCFDCFINGQIVTFPSKKCKEFFALLVALNGKTLTMDKAITYLYPDKDIEKAKISYRDIVWKLRKLFESLSFNGVVFRRGETTLLLDHITCDYIEVINHQKEYDGSPLMPEYDWSIEFENSLESA